MGPEVVLGDVT